MASRPKSVLVRYRGILYRLNLIACRKGLVDCQVMGELDSMESLSARVDISRSTASRFFSGRPTSLAVTLRILDALHLEFEDVAQQVKEGDDEDDSEGDDSGTRGQGQAPPSNGRDSAARRAEETKGR